MPNQQTDSCSFKRPARLPVVIAMLAIIGPTCFSAPQQPQSALQITSPANNAVVSPGQSISVSVTSPNNSAFTQVFVIGGAPIGASVMASSVPAQFSLAIPTKISLGEHLLTAVGTTSAKQDLYSPSIDLDVERSDLPSRISADPDRLIFTSQGETSPLSVQTNFADGTFYDATRSSNLAFSSSDTGVATVDSSGTVKAVAKGSATITVTYTAGTQTITTSVSVSVPRPVITPSPATLDFGNQNIE